MYNIHRLVRRAGLSTTLNPTFTTTHRHTHPSDPEGVRNTLFGRPV